MSSLRSSGASSSISRRRRSGSAEHFPRGLEARARWAASPGDRGSGWRRWRRRPGAAARAARERRADLRPPTGAAASRCAMGSSSSTPRRRGRARTRRRARRAARRRPAGSASRARPCLGDAVEQLARRAGQDPGVAELRQLEQRRARPARGCRCAWPRRPDLQPTDQDLELALGKLPEHVDEADREEPGWRSLWDGIGARSSSTGGNAFARLACPEKSPFSGLLSASAFLKP